MRTGPPDAVNFSCTVVDSPALTLNWPPTRLTWPVTPHAEPGLIVPPALTLPVACSTSTSTAPAAAPTERATKRKLEKPRSTQIAGDVADAPAASCSDFLPSAGPSLIVELSAATEAPPASVQPFAPASKSPSGASVYSEVSLKALKIVVNVRGAHGAAEAAVAAGAGAATARLIRAARPAATPPFQIRFKGIPSSGNSTS